jgi:hypothetical protein
VLMIKVAAAMLLLLGSGLIFKALVAMDAPTLPLRPLRPLRRRALATAPAGQIEEPAPLRHAA